MPVMIPVKTNDAKWFNSEIMLIKKRGDVLSIVSAMELVCRNPNLPPDMMKHYMRVAIALAETLIAEGLLLPDQTREAWERTFGIKIPKVILEKNLPPDPQTH